MKTNANFKTLSLALICLVILGIRPAFSSTPAAVKNKNNNIRVNAPANLSTVTRLLRLKLYLDAYDYDDVAIGFNSGASPLYNPNEDSKYLQGMDSAEGLSCYSSDGVPLSIDFLPLPTLKQETIRLDVQAKNSGQLTLERTELDSLPSIYSVWLMDNYKKDSLNLRTDTAYQFSINKADTTSFGSNRFSIVIRQEAALSVQLLNFTAIKASNGAQISWTTQNEQNYTTFTVERSSDDGNTFDSIDSLISRNLGDYSFDDKNPPAGSDLYRLKIQDMNGTFSYSNIVTLLFSTSNSTAAADIRVYPNPAISVINLAIDKSSNTAPSGIMASAQGNSFETSYAANPGTVSSTSAYSIKILNLTGNVIKTATSSTPSWQGNISSLPPGTYIVQVVNYANSSMVGRSTFVKL